MDAASQIRTHDAQLFRDVFNARPEGQPLFVNPAFCAMLGFSEEELRNKTERKLAHAALANVSRKLIEAQEQERSRIGRELHDDIGQRLALLALQLQLLKEDTLISPEVRSRMGEFQKQSIGDCHRYSILITRVALGKTAIFGNCCGHERLLQRIRRATKGGD